MTLTLNDNNGVFIVSPTTIPQSSVNLDTPVEVAVTFHPSVEGRFSGSLVLSSTGAQSITVELSGIANEGNTASDPYLDISKYETIDEAGWNTSDIRNLYKYTEYENEECGWLTLSNYGVIKADATQNWFTNGGTIRTGSDTWTAIDVFPGSASYFAGEGQFADWSDDFQTFFVTNCMQVKQLSVNRGSSAYPLKMFIYECTLNDDGTLTTSETAVQTKQSTTTNTKEVLASDELDPSKIYKVAIFNEFSKLYEIGFKTPLNAIETPIATDATDVKADGFTANWSLCPSATSYTLRVMPKSSQLDERIITGITGLSYDVTGLLPATTYIYDVRAVKGNIHGEWSNTIEVTTLAGGVYGDVNCDGQVTATDITCIYNYLLNNDQTFVATSDVNGDGSITATDITCIYNILLGTN